MEDTHLIDENKIEKLVFVLAITEICLIEKKPEFEYTFLDNSTINNRFFMSAISSLSSHHSSHSINTQPLPPPRLDYLDKDHVKVTGHSREHVLAWWQENKSKNFNDQIVADKGDKPNECILRLGLGYQNQGIHIEDVLKKASMDCENLPPSNLREFILTHPDKTYLIDRRSYKILKLIDGKGSYGDVFLAQDVETTNMVAIKILRIPEDREHKELKKMQDEGGHPNIVKYIGDSKIWNKTWIVMEYIEGIKLGEYMQTSSWSEELNNQYQNAISFMATCGVESERENDNENILITSKDGKPIVKLIDFGTLARQ